MTQFIYTSHCIPISQVETGGFNLHQQGKFFRYDTSYKYKSIPKLRERVGLFTSPTSPKPLQEFEIQWLFFGFKLVKEVTEEYLENAHKFLF